MKRFLVAAVLGLSLSVGTWAQSDDTKLADLTVGDLKILAQTWSLEVQKSRYVHRAEVSSFIIPGAGQFMVGDPLGGVLNLTGEIALVGGTLYTAWALLPADVRNATGENRRDLIGNYWATDPGKVAVSAAVLAGGLTLSILHRFWASDNAGDTARANIDAGKVTFEPEIGLGSIGFRGRF